MDWCWQETPTLARSGVSKSQGWLYNITQFEVFGCVYLDPVIPCQEIWILVSVQQDVTGIKPELLPSSNDALLMKARLKMPP